MLSATIRDFEALKRWLVTHERVPDSFLAFYIKENDEQEEDNQDDPRAVCAVRRGSYGVECSAAIEALPRNVRVGVLLHELGHHAVDAFKDEDDEVDVDLWVVTHVPEAAYTYVERVEYIHPLTGKKVEARNIETVGDDFLELIYD